MRIEGATVTGEPGPEGYPMEVSGRDYPRTGVQNALSNGLAYGDRVVMFAGGENEYPVAIGLNPWVF